jgi:hypothetical protein
MANLPQEYEQNVFINCPFDDAYKVLFDAIVFTVQIAGFRPRCALEASNAGEARLEKIMNIISECKYAVHDISRTELDSINSLPRFNMPLELGLDLGARRYGVGLLRTKKLLVLDKNRHRYQKFISDLAGLDVIAHFGNPKQVIRHVRDWLSLESKRTNIPGGLYMFRRYKLFAKELPLFCRDKKLEVRELTFGDFAHILRIWLEEDEQ